jgi:hypothetical protein
VKPRLRVGEILRFWFPLVLTAQMMTLSMPIINMGIGRRLEATTQLAAYSVGFGVAVVFNSPMLVVHHVVSALAASREILRRVALMAVGLGCAVAAMDLVIALTPVGRAVFVNLIHAPPNVAAQAQLTVGVMAPIPVLLALRGLGWGLALRAKRTTLITASTVSRLSTLVSLVVLGTWLAWLTGAAVGALALTGGILVETLLILALTARNWRILPEQVERAPGAGWIAGFGAPLVMAALAMTMMRPLVNAMLGRMAQPELALAAFGVVQPLLLVTCSPLLSFNSVGLVLPRSRQDDRRVLSVAAGIAALLALPLAALGFSPAGVWFLQRVFSLPQVMSRYTAAGLMLMAVAPPFIGLRATCQGFLTRAHRTRPIALSSLVKLGSVALAGMIVVRLWSSANGAAVGIGLVVMGDLLDSTILFLAYRRLGDGASDQAGC